MMFICRLRNFVLSLCLSLVLVSGNAKAMVWSDVPDSITLYSDIAQMYIHQGTMLVDETVKSLISDLKSMSKGFFSRFDKKDEPKVPGAKELQPSSIADIYDYHSVKTAVDKLFFEYPSDEVPVQILYRAKAREFYDDTLIEAFTSVRELEKNYIQIEEKIADTIETYGKAQDENEGIYNNMMIEYETDELLRVIQELVAIKGQIYAAGAMLNSTEPLYYGKPGKGIQFIIVEEKDNKKKRSFKNALKEGKQLFKNAKGIKNSVDDLRESTDDLLHGSNKYMEEHYQKDEAAEKIKDFEDKYQSGKDDFNRIKDKIF